MAAAVANVAPSTVSMRPKRMSLVVMPLSTVALCWKKSIQGVTVAPMSARTIRRVSLLKPGSGCQVMNARPTECQLGVGHERDGNEDQVECGGGEGDAFPGPIAVTHQGGVEDDQRDEDCDPGTDAEETEAGADGDELGDESEEVADAEVDHGEPSPEGAEAVEDEFGVAAMGGGAEADGHFLDDDGHAEGEGDEGDERIRCRTWRRWRRRRACWGRRFLRA